MDKKTKAVKVLGALEKEYKGAKVALNFSSPLELLVATILSAQATDRLVNEVTVGLFRKFRTAKDFADAPLRGIEHSIRRVNFFRNKAKNIKACCEKILQDFNGDVPRTIEGLTALPGVGRKTANIVLAEAFGVHALAVDTHVKRVSLRLGLASSEDPDEIEMELCSIIPRPRWAITTRLFIVHGRQTCKAKAPLCSICAVSGWCDWFKAIARP
jgi:endonuclease-3